ncbi:MAG: Ig-like domain-containing protein [Patescibacteria group bacterium]
MRNKTHKKILKFAATVMVAAVLTSLLAGLSLTSAQAIEPGPTGTTAIATATADTKEPSAVENLKATPGDGQVQLTWDNSTDNVGVTGYKIYRGTHSVKTSEDQYDLPAIPVGNVKSYTVKNLTNGQAYYFSLTALDAAGNESLDYALEAHATPKEGLHLASIEDNGKAPEVKDVKTEDVITVTVEFSEPVKLPEEHPASAFTIQKTLDKARLQVQKAEIDARDESGVTVLLTTAPQQKDVEYMVTAGIEVQDYFNNPVISGTSDTGTFDGSDKQNERVTPPPSSSPDTQAPSVTAGSADYSNRVTVSFSEPVKLPENPLNNFSIHKKGTQQVLKVLNVSLSVDKQTVYVSTDPQQAVEYEVRVTGVKDLAGNSVDVKANSVTFTGKTTGITDLIPPEDVTNLIARIKDAEKNIVELRWKPSKNSAKDLQDQVLYQSDDRSGKAFGDGTSLGSTTVALEVQDLQAGNWYTFKVTSKDENGNESKGALRSVYLPQTGPGAIAAGITSLVMGWYSRRKKK